MLMLKTLPAAKGSRNMKARLEPFSRSFWKKKGRCQRPWGLVHILAGCFHMPRCLVQAYFLPCQKICLGTVTPPAPLTPQKSESEVQRAQHSSRQSSANSSHRINT